MRFRPIQNIGVSYRKQVHIYSTCLNYRAQPAATRKKIDRLCEEIGGGGEMTAALKEVLTTGGNVEAIALRHYVSKSALSRRRAEFYRRFR